MGTAARALTFALRAERQKDNLFAKTENHPRHALRRRGWQSDEARLVEPISQEIGWLEREAATLRKLRDTMFGIA